jgi:hypothetical protein
LRCAARSLASSSSFRSRALKSRRVACPSCLQRRDRLSARSQRCGTVMPRHAPVFDVRVRAQVLGHAPRGRREEARAALFRAALGGRPRGAMRGRHRGGSGERNAQARGAGRGAHASARGRGTGRAGVSAQIWLRLV